MLCPCAGCYSQVYKATGGVYLKEPQNKILHLKFSRHVHGTLTVVEMFCSHPCVHRDKLLIVQHRQPIAEL